MHMQIFSVQENFANAKYALNKQIFCVLQPYCNAEKPMVSRVDKVHTLSTTGNIFSIFSY